MILTLLERLAIPAVDLVELFGEGLPWSKNGLV